MRLQPEPTRHFSLLVKPASADCNLSCDYCFYLSRSGLYPQGRVHRMSDEVLGRTIASFMATDQPQYSFGWQGGEPTLMGVEFFRRVTELQQRHGRAGAVVANGLQTNAILIDDAWARHLSAYKFLVGVSLDGPAYLHDHYRKKMGGQPSHGEVLRGIQHLQDHRVDFNILVLVNDRNATRAAEVYHYLCVNNWRYHQYIPCVEFDARGALLPFSVTAAAWGDFLCTIFDLWVKSDAGKVSIRLFDTVLAYLAKGDRNICHMGSNCCQYCVVEHNGDVYPCDFFVNRELKLGNVSTHTWDEIQQSQTYVDFGAAKSRWHETCTKCAYLDLCAGDCLKHRSPQHQHRDPQAVSALCAGWKKFYQHALPRLRQIARQVQSDRGQGPVSPSPRLGASSTRHSKDIGRNAPCPCGSGKKYKRCCLSKR